MGFMMRSPALQRPPKKMKASGDENAAKSAHASPSILPVNSKISWATSSPLSAAMDTSRDSISSSGFSRSSDGRSVVCSISRAVRATPLAEQYASRQPLRPHPQGRASGRRSMITWPNSPAKPSQPYTSWPLITMPEPTPVPRVMTMKFFMPRAAP